MNKYWLQPRLSLASVYTIQNCWFSSKWSSSVMIVFKRDISDTFDVISKFSQGYWNIFTIGVVRLNTITIMIRNDVKSRPDTFIEIWSASDDVHVGVGSHSCFQTWFYVFYFKSKTSLGKFLMRRKRLFDRISEKACGSDQRQRPADKTMGFHIWQGYHGRCDQTMNAYALSCSSSVSLIFINLKIIKSAGRFDCVYP